MLASVPFATLPRPAPPPSAAAWFLLLPGPAVLRLPRACRDVPLLHDYLRGILRVTTQTDGGWFTIWAIHLVTTSR